MKAIKHLLTALILLLFLSESLSAQGFGFGKRSLKNETEALRLSITNTALPVALGWATSRLFKSDTGQAVGGGMVLYGLLVGPSTGNFYATDYVRGSFGIMARTGAGLLLKDATDEVLGRDVADQFGWDERSVSFSDTEIWLGTGIAAISIAYNILTAKKSAREYNASLGYRVSVEPSPYHQRPVPMISTRIPF